MALTRFAGVVLFPVQLAGCASGGYPTPDAMRRHRSPKRRTPYLLMLLLLSGCAATYRLPTDNGWGYEGELQGMKLVTVFENQSQCETRRAIGLMAQSMQKAIQASLGPCEAMTLAPGGTLYWGIGVPDAGGFILFRDEKSCHWFREGWTEVPTWKKTVCMPVGLQRGKPASS